MIDLGRVEAEALIRRGRPVVVLLSGGPDSTALLHVATLICGPGVVWALHLDYGLRSESGADASACEALAAHLGVPIRVERPTRPQRAHNLQAWAREVRYASARRLAAAHTGPDRPADVAAGHTAEDQAETILYRLAASPSRRALLGMRPREGDLVRPLLAHTREDTTAHCAAHGLRPVADASNDSDAYARNRVRRRLLPVLQAIHPAAVANVNAVAETLRAEAELLDALVDATLREGNPDVPDGIGLERLGELPVALARLVIQRLADAAAPGGIAPGAARRTEEILALAARSTGPGLAALDLPGGVRAQLEHGALRITATPAVERERERAAEVRRRSRAATLRAP